MMPLFLTLRTKTCGRGWSGGVDGMEDDVTGGDFPDSDIPHGAGVLIVQLLVSTLYAQSRQTGRAVFTPYSQH